MLWATADMIKRYRGRGSQSGCGNSLPVDRAEKRLRMGAVHSFWRVFDRLITFDKITFDKITFDKMELDEFWEQSNSTRRLWHTEHFMRWVVSCTKTNFSEVVHPLNFWKKTIFLCLKLDQTVIFSLPTLFFHYKHRWFFPPIILNERALEPTFYAAGQWRRHLRSTVHVAPPKLPAVLPLLVYLHSSLIECIYLYGRRPTASLDCASRVMDTRQIGE